MDIPQGAGAAEAREVKPRRAVPFGDVACPIHPQEVHGDAALPWTLQRAQPMADLFQAHAETLGELLHIMSKIPGGSLERPIGHQECTGGVVTQPDAADL